MNDTKYSIIVTVRKGERDKLWNVLDSVGAQKFKDYELIVVCDSCEDKSAKDSKDRNALVIETDYDNEFLARNAGLDAASGEWVFILNADTVFLHGSMLDEMNRVAGKQGDSIVNYAHYEQGTGYHTQTATGMSTKPWTRCCKRDLIGDTRFTKDRETSDSKFFGELIAKKPDIVFWNVPILYVTSERR